MNAVEVRGLEYRYADGTLALRHVSFAVVEGERVALIGRTARASPRFSCT